MPQWRHTTLHDEMMWVAFNECKMLTNCVRLHKWEIQTRLVVSLSEQNFSCVWRNACFWPCLRYILVWGFVYRHCQLLRTCVMQVAMQLEIWCSLAWYTIGLVLVHLVKCVSHHFVSCKLACHSDLPGGSLFVPRVTFAVEKMYVASESNKHLSWTTRAKIHWPSLLWVVNSNSNNFWLY